MIPMHDAITIVSGLPRSGTSMMMKMLEAGGMDVVTDRLREADEDNPMGYYELETVKAVKEDVSWLEGMEGRAVKMVTMLLYDLPPEKRYKVIFMKRNIQEILASQRKMLQRKGDGGSMDEGQLDRLFRTHLEEMAAWLGKQEHMEVLYVNYNDLMGQARDHVQALSLFLDGRLDVDKALAVIDDSLYRNRSASPAGGGEAAPGQTSEGNQTSEGDKDKIEEQLKALGYL